MVILDAQADTHHEDAGPDDNAGCKQRLFSLVGLAFGPRGLELLPNHLRRPMMLRPRPGRAPQCHLFSLACDVVAVVADAEGRRARIIWLYSNLSLRGGVRRPGMCRDERSFSECGRVAVRRANCAPPAITIIYYRYVLSSGGSCYPIYLLFTRLLVSSSVGGGRAERSLCL